MKNLKKNIMSILFHFLTFAITLALLIGIDLWNFRFDWTLITAAYLYMKVLMSLGYLTIKISLANLIYDTKEVTDENYVSLLTDLGEASKKHRGYRFNDRINRLDFQNKADTWVRLKEKELFDHERRIPDIVVEEMKNLPPAEYSKKTKKWLKKKNRLVEELNERWIYDNLLTQKIGYPEITPQEVLYGSMEFQPKKSLLDRAPLKRIIFKNLPFTILTFAATLVLGTLTDITSATGIGLFVSIMSILVILMVNVTMGIINGIRAHRSRNMNANKRSEIMINYKEGVYDSLPEVPKREVYKEIATEETVETTDKTVEKEAIINDNLLNNEEILTIKETSNSI